MEPLANKLRPKDLEGFIGQEHLVGDNMPFRIAIEKGQIFFVYTLGSSWSRQDDIIKNLCKGN